MSDLIDRQAVFDALIEKGQNSKRYKLGENWELNLPEIIEAINVIPSAKPERKTKIEMNWATYFDNMGTAVIHIPYSYKCGNCGCQLQRTYDGIDINYCPECGYRLEWE